MRKQPHRRELTVPPIQVRKNARMGQPDPDRPWEWLYALTGTGMWSFTHARFDVQVVSPFPRVNSGDIWIATHRAETDVPLLAGLMFTRGGMWRRGAPRVHFAARDDLFAPGVVAAGLRAPRPIARAVWPLSPGPWLPRVRAHPVRRPTGAKLGQVLCAADPDTHVSDVLSVRLIELIATRARRLRRPAPTRAGDVVGADFARVLWEDVDGADFPGAAGAQLWRRHISRTATDLRRIVGVVRDGEPLLLFPEGRVSPDGRIGPVGDVLRVVATHGRARRIVPVGLAYDPLHRGRVTVAVGNVPMPDVRSDFVTTAEATLRRATPVTCGQTVAGWLVDDAAPASVEDLRRRLDRTIDRARDEGRPIAQELTNTNARERRLNEALAAVRARGLLAGRNASPDRPRARRDPQIARLATEDAAVWREPESPPSRTSH